MASFRAGGIGRWPNVKLREYSSFAWTASSMMLIDLLFRVVKKQKARLAMMVEGGP
jgi:hypothetical protein